MAPTFPCPKCTQSITTGAAPGQKTRCKKCDERVRVPLRDAEPAPHLTPAAEDPCAKKKDSTGLTAPAGALSMLSGKSADKPAKKAGAKAKRREGMEKAKSLGMIFTVCTAQLH